MKENYKTKEEEMAAIWDQFEMAALNEIADLGEELVDDFEANKLDEALLSEQDKIRFRNIVGAREFAKKQEIEDNANGGRPWWAVIEGRVW